MCSNSQINRRGFSVLHRVVVSFSDLNWFLVQLEKTNDPIFIGKTEMERYTIKGVPAKRIDVVVAPLETFHNQDVVMEIVDKEGKIDGSIRRRITIRPCVGGLDSVVKATFSCNFDKKFIGLTLWRGGVIWEQSFERLRSDLEDYNVSRIIMWHYRRYFSHLISVEHEVMELAEAFESMHPGIREMTLAEANRLASNDLYRLSRDLGWRKLSKREQVHHKIDKIWVKSDSVGPLGNSQGVGDYTLDSAHNGRGVNVMM